MIQVPSANNASAASISRQLATTLSIVPSIAATATADAGKARLGGYAPTLLPCRHPAVEKCSMSRAPPSRLDVYQT